MQFLTFLMDLEVLLLLLCSLVSQVDAVGLEVSSWENLLVSLSCALALQSG